MPTAEKARATSGLIQSLESLRTRTRIHLLVDGVASTCLAFVTICLLSFGLDRIFKLPWGQRAGVLAVLGTVLAVLVWRRIVSRLRVPLPLAELARQVERLDPKLDWRLVSAVQFLEGSDPRGSRELADLVVADAEQLAKSVSFGATLDTGAVVARSARGAFVLACGLSLVFGFPNAARTWFERNVLLSTTASWPKNTELHVAAQSAGVVTPLGAGRMKVAMPRGADLAILVSASKEMPTRVSLAFEYEGTKVVGSRELGFVNGRFRTIFDKVAEGFTFHVKGGDDELGPVVVQVVRPPWLEGFTIDAEPPAYTRLPPKPYGLEAGEIALPAGTRVKVSARCSKKLTKAWLEARFAGARLDAPPTKVEATMPPAGDRFEASFVLDKTAQCSIDVRDSDDLALEHPVAFTLRAVPDAPPKVQLLVTGVGQLVTPEALIPLELKATDDYGLHSGVLRYKTSGLNQKAAEGALDVGIEGRKREVNLPFALEVGKLGLQAGTFFNFFVEVRDDDPLGQKTTASSGFALRVVNPEELLMDLIRRQHELRRELERTRDDEDKLAAGLENLDAKVQERAPKTQRAVMKSVSDAARAMMSIVEEMKNNKLLDERARTRLVEDVVAPLEALRDGELVKARDLADATVGTPDEKDKVARSHEAAASARVVTGELDVIIAHMKRVADLAELVAKLRDFIKKQRDLMEEARQRK